MKKQLTEEEIISLCKRKGLECNIIGEKVIIETGIGSWYFKLNSQQNISVYHNNYSFADRGLKFVNNYHIQKKKFDTRKEVIEYIYCHDKGFYRPRITSLEKAFRRAERTRKK